MTVHCLAAEPRETIRAVQDLTYSPSCTTNETDARSATHSHDCAYEACVLDARSGPATDRRSAAAPS